MPIEHDPLSPEPPETSELHQRLFQEWDDQAQGQLEIAQQIRGYILDFAERIDGQMILLISLNFQIGQLHDQVRLNQFQTWILGRISLKEKLVLAQRLVMSRPDCPHKTAMLGLFEPLMHFADYRNRVAHSIIDRDTANLIRRLSEIDPGNPDSHHQLIHEEETFLTIHKRTKKELTVTNITTDEMLSELAQGARSLAAFADLLFESLHMFELEQSDCPEPAE